MIEQDTFCLDFNLTPMTNDISTGFHKDENLLLPAKMLNGLSSFKNWPDFKNTNTFSSTKPENNVSNDKLLKLEEENVLLEQRIHSLTQENANITKQSEFERILLQDEIFIQKQTITKLTNIINQYLQKEIKNRDSLINCMSGLKEDSASSVRSQTMSKVSDYNESGSLHLSSNNKVNKYVRKNSSGNRGAKASKIFAEILKQHNQVNDSLTKNKKALLKHTEDTRSQSLPYNMEFLLNKPLEEIDTFTSMTAPVRPSFMEDEGIQYEPSPTGVHISDVENTSNAEIMSHNIATVSQVIKNAHKTHHSPICEQDIPVYDFVKCPKRVIDLWNEFTISTPTKASILKMNEMYASAWRKLSPALDKQYSRRHMVYRAIMHGVDKKGFTVNQCIEILEQTRMRYFDSVTGKEVSSKFVQAKDIETGKIIQKQKSIGWLTNFANIPDILKS